MIVNQFNTFVASLVMSLTIFISLPARADENSHFDESISFDEQLTHADNIRSSHPKQFLVLVNELNQQTDNTSSSQQYHLDYLNLYLLMYQGNLNEATTSAKALINSNANSLLKFRAKIALINIFNPEPLTEEIS
mgnify:CR=1 FL=1